MTAVDVLRRRVPPPKGPSVGTLMAMTLELSILGTFFAKGSLLGVLLCAAYAWFSATWSVLSLPRDDE